jgi:hypothetical protein
MVFQIDNMPWGQKGAFSQYFLCFLVIAERANVSKVEGVVDWLDLQDLYHKY